MKIYTLIEDSRHEGSALLCEHGLSLYFEYGGQRILFDTGASDAFIYNATLIGIDLLKVNVCVLSHVHADHTGGLANFLDINRHAKVYLKSAASGDFYAKRPRQNVYSGIDQKLLKSAAHRLCYFDGDIPIADGVFACSISQYRRLPGYAQTMLEMRDGVFVKDSLEHELYVTILLPSGAVVLTGCAHHGLLNLLMTAKERYGSIAGIAGGFHLEGSKSVRREPDSEVSAIAKILTENKIKKVYTGHCTGERAFEKLSLMARVRHMRTGDVLEF